MNTQQELVRVAVEAPTGTRKKSGWVKHVQGLDMTKNNGFAFLGRFLRDGFHDLPKGAVLVYFTPSTNSSSSQKASVYVVSPDYQDNMHKVAGPYDWHREFLFIRDAVAKELNAAAKPDATIAPDTPLDEVSATLSWKLKALPWKEAQLYVLHTQFISATTGSVASVELRIVPGSNGSPNPQKGPTLFVQCRPHDNFDRVVLDELATGSDRDVVTIDSLSVQLGVDMRAVHSAAQNVWRRINEVALIQQS